ncbi:hypothetical protein J4G33_04465 [Actinotalea sp. BY-33]|uniref:PGAP1-like protein n=1 Tax=Actinotalea soli TaxID=2819234 RepID=A0A939LNH5_9CELL|nr:hypothetical protein [Actinotalea soli]MBO1751051.1 hypothetical protein [Actinotalea soli]
MSAAAPPSEIVRPPSADLVGLPPGVRVRGGYGSTRVHLDELEHAAVLLCRLAELLEHAGARALRLGATVEDAARWSPTTAQAAREALAEVATRPGGCLAVAASARALAAALRLAAESYRQADALVSRLGAAIPATAAVGGLVLGEAGPVGWAAGAALTGVGALAVLTHGLARSGAATLSGQGASAQWLPTSPPDARVVEPAVAGIAGFLLGALPGRRPLDPTPVPEAARVLDTGVRIASPLAGVPTSSLVVAPKVETPSPWGPDRTQPPAPDGAGEVLRQVADHYAPGGGGDGTVGVQELTHPDGTRSWVVTVPGTQDWSPLPGSNPADLSSNLRLMAERPDDATEVVLRAMAAARIEPGEPVLLAGHSQGGIAAMEVAGDPRAERYSIAAVVTAGSPVGHLPLKDGVQALHLEHGTDYVPTLDGRANPTAGNRTTVAVDLAEAADPADRAAALSPVAAHDARRYAATADRLAGSDHASLRAVDQAIQGVLGGGQAEARMMRFTGVRVPEDPAALSPGGRG